MHQRHEYSQADERSWVMESSACSARSRIVPTLLRPRREHPFPLPFRTLHQLALAAQKTTLKLNGLKQ